MSRHRQPPVVCPRAHALVRRWAVVVAVLALLVAAVAEMLR